MSVIHKKLFHSFTDEQDLDLDVEMLKDFSYYVRDNDRGKILSNIGGWQSSNLDIKIPELSSLVSEIMHSAERLLLKYELPKTFIIDPLWININGHKDFNQYHEHPRAMFGGVFYITAPENCGDLVMVNPITVHQHYINPAQLDNFNEFNSYSWTVEPKVNRMVMFPAWVPHFVFPNQSTEDRISIAFNICCGV